MNALPTGFWTVYCREARTHLKKIFFAQTEDLQAAVGATKTSNSVQPDSSEGGYYDLGREPNKVWIQSPMILNGVCVKWRGYIDINQLEGCGKFDYDEARGSVEAEALRLSMGKSMRKMSEGALEA